MLAKKKCENSKYSYYKHYFPRFLIERQKLKMRKIQFGIIIIIPYKNFFLS